METGRDAPRVVQSETHWPTRDRALECRFGRRVQSADRRAPGTLRPTEAGEGKLWGAEPQTARRTLRRRAPQVAQAGRAQRVLRFAAKQLAGRTRPRLLAPGLKAPKGPAFCMRVPAFSLTRSPQTAPPV